MTRVTLSTIVPQPDCVSLTACEKKFNPADGAPPPPRSFPPAI